MTSKVEKKAIKNYNYEKSNDQVKQSEKCESSDHMKQSEDFESKAVVFQKDKVFCLGIIESVPDKDFMCVSVLEPIKAMQSKNDKFGRYWSQTAHMILITKEDILPVFPVIEIDTKLSKNTGNQQIIIYHLMNDDIMDLFVPSAK